MTLPVRWGRNTHFCGDSIIVQQVFNEPGGFCDQARAAALAATPPAANTGGFVPASPVGGSLPAALVTGSGKASTSPAWPTAPTLNFTSMGGNSFTIALVSANYATFITPFQFDLLILACVVNDVVSATPLGTHLATYRAFLDRVHADRPAANVLCLGAFCNGEQWTAGSPNHYVSGLDGNAWDANVQTCCAERPGWTLYGDQALATLGYQAAHNTPAPGVNTGILTVDGVHPNAPTGRVFWGTNAMQFITVTP